MVMWLACLALQIFAIHHCKSCNFCIYVGHIVLLYTTMICGVHTILCSTTWGYQLCSLEIRPLKWVLSSDEFELEFSSSSRAELWRFWAEPSWGTSIFELKPSWQYWQYVCQKIAFFIFFENFYNFAPVSWFQSTSWSLNMNLCSTNVFLELNRMI